MSFSDLTNALRFLSIDAVERAQSGHPGMPLGMADIAAVLWTKFLKHNPKNPYWFNRDRFVLSNGHGSMLLYALLHMTGYALTIEDLKQFRQLHSKTPGHPEFGETLGVETSTGPLGQGLANAVGMAIAEKILATTFNRLELELINHFTYVFVGDGCLMEGISHEACSLAGTLSLGKLIVFYDDNGISIDGKVEGWFKDDTATRFKAYNWQVIDQIDGHDPFTVEEAIIEAQKNIDQPSLIICKTIIGLGSPVANSEKAHGAPLGAAGIAEARKTFNWSYEAFEVPSKTYEQWNHLEKGQKVEAQWLKICQRYREQFPALYEEFLRRSNGDLPDNWQIKAEDFIEQCLQYEGAQATRKSSQQVIEYFAALLPEMLGGSADLTSSNNTDWSGSKALSAGDFSGNYLFYGVREFAMAAIMNGLALHGGFIPYGGTFLVFADYARNAIRLSALMRQRVIYVFTHDSVGLGEDGPTHQPIEHISMLRLTPNLLVGRPADLMETAIAWGQALELQSGPSCLVLTRQNLPALGQERVAENLKKGGYILKDCEGLPEAILIATGSEVHLALEAATQLQALGRNIRVVSMPCSERFLSQAASYQEQVLPKSIRKRIAIEAGASTYWYRFVGLDGKVIGIDRFGVSAPGAQALQFLGITVENIISAFNAI